MHGDEESLLQEASRSIGHAVRAEEGGAVVESQNRSLEAVSSGWVQVIHDRPRESLITPMRIDGVPPVRALTSLRITEGKYVPSGEVLSKVDNWTSRSEAHLQMPMMWTGSTWFLKRSCTNLESAVTLGTSLVASDYRSGERPNRMSRQRLSLAGGPSDRLAGSSAHLKLGSTPTCGIESEECTRGKVESLMSIQLICGEGAGSGRVTSVNMDGGASRCDRMTRVRTTAPCFSYGDLVRPKIGVSDVLPAGE